MLHIEKKKPAAVSSNDELVACLIDEIRGLRDDLAARADSRIAAEQKAAVNCAPIPAPVVELREPAPPTIPIWAPGKPAPAAPVITPPPADKPSKRGR